VFINIRPFKTSDLVQLIHVYRSAFAEPPWNEFMKCSCCNVEYSKKEVDSSNRGQKCKKCDQPLNLVEFWSETEITEDLNYASSQQNPLILVAESKNVIIGMSWGYKIPLEKFPFLTGKVSPESNYMDEIAVRGDSRLRGIGTIIGETYISKVRQQGLKEIVLRTDERNTSSMKLFNKLGLSSISDLDSSRGKVYDPEFTNRIYLRREL